MLRPDEVMKQKEIKKIQFGGWTKRHFSDIREQIKRRDKKDFVLSATDEVVSFGESISSSGADRIKK